MIVLFMKTRFNLPRFRLLSTSLLTRELLKVGNQLRGLHILKEQMPGIAASILLYFAWMLSWHQVYVGHCPMGDAQPLEIAILLSAVPYIVGFMLLGSLRMKTAGLILSLPLVPMMAWQGIWGMRLFIVVNIEGLSACTLTVGAPFGPASADWLEQGAGLYYIFVSTVSILGLGYAYRRRWRDANRRRQLEAFD